MALFITFTVSNGYKKAPLTGAGHKCLFVC